MCECISTNSFVNELINLIACISFFRHNIYILGVNSICSSA